MNRTIFTLGKIKNWKRFNVDTSTVFLAGLNKEIIFDKIYKKILKLVAIKNLNYKAY